MTQKSDQPGTSLPRLLLADQGGDPMSALERLAHELPAGAAGSSNDQEIHGKACCLRFTPTALRLRTRHLVHVIVLAGVLGHLQADLLPSAGFGDRLVLDLHGFDALAKIARVSEDADRVAHAQGSRFEPYRRDGKMP